MGKKVSNILFFWGAFVLKAPTLEEGSLLLKMHVTQ